MTEKKRIPTEIWSRIVGYWRPMVIGGTPSVNPGKYREFKDRKVYEVPTDGRAKD